MEGLPFFSSTKEKLNNWLDEWKREHFCGVFPLGSQCCFQELESLELDIDNHSPKIRDIRETPELSDVLIISGAISYKFKPYLMDIYHQLKDDSQVVLLGNCAIDGGLYQNYAVESRLKDEIKVDLEIPGCPPTPQQIYQGLKSLGRKQVVDS